MRLVVAGTSLGLLLGACGELPSREVGFRSTDPAGRLQALRDAAASGDRDAIPGLIASLDADEACPRMLAQTALTRLVGADGGYRFDDPEPERRQAIRRWHAWWGQGGRGIPSSSGEPSGVPVARER